MFSRQSFTNTDNTENNTPPVSPFASIPAAAPSITGASDVCYDILFSKFPSYLVSNVVAVFGTTASGKTSFINELLRAKVSPENLVHCCGEGHLIGSAEGPKKEGEADAVTARSAAATPTGPHTAALPHSQTYVDAPEHRALTPSFLFVKTGGRVVDYSTIIPHVRLVKPLTHTLYDRLATLASENDTKGRKKNVDNSMRDDRVAMEGVLEQYRKREEEGWHHDYDKAMHQPVRNLSTIVPVAQRLAHTVCLKGTEKAFAEPQAPPAPPDRAIESYTPVHPPPFCSSVVDKRTFATVVREAGLLGVLPTEYWYGSSSNTTTTNTTSNAAPTATPTTSSEEMQPLVPTSVTLVDGTTLLAQPSWIPGASGNSPSSSLSGAVWDKHKLMSTAVIEMTYGTAPLPTSASSEAGSGKSWWSRLIGGGGSSTKDLPTAVTAPASSSLSSALTATAAGCSTLQDSLWRTAPPVNAAGAYIFQNATKVFYMLPANKLDQESVVATFVKRCVAMAFPSEDASVPGGSIQLQPMKGKRGTSTEENPVALVAAPHPRVLTIQPVLSKLDLYTKVHAHGQELSIRVAKKAAQPLYERYIAMEGNVKSSNASSSPDTADNNSSSSDNKAPSKIPFSAKLLPTPLVLALDGFQLGNYDSERPEKEGVIFGRRKSEVLERHTFQTVRTQHICDVISDIYRQLLRNRTVQQPTDNNSGSGGTTPVFGTSAEVEEDERVVASLGQYQRCPGF